jgi:hypothetical protein
MTDATAFETAGQSMGPTAGQAAPISDATNGVGGSASSSGDAALAPESDEVPGGPTSPEALVSQSIGSLRAGALTLNLASIAAENLHEFCDAMPLASSNSGLGPLPVMCGNIPFWSQRLLEQSMSSFAIPSAVSPIAPQASLPTVAAEPPSSTAASSTSASTSAEAPAAADTSSSSGGVGGGY